jgi:hypothetical protein
VDGGVRSPLNESPSTKFANRRLLQPPRRLEPERTGSPPVSGSKLVLSSRNDEPWQVVRDASAWSRVDELGTPTPVV